MDKLFKFEIITIGSSIQQLKDSNKCINRPMIEVDGKIKKWGDEYIIIYNAINKKDCAGLRYIGAFSFDKNAKKFVKLFKEIDIPIDYVDFYIVSMKIDTSEKINKSDSFIKHNPDSYSCILSCAYNKTDDSLYENELLVICQHGDKIVVDGQVLLFDEDLKVFS